MAQLLSGRPADEGLSSRWNDLRKLSPADFPIDPAAVRAWREREIGDCLHEGDLQAAEFHYWWLVAEIALTARAAK
jgi:hypothetical protein